MAHGYLGDGYGAHGDFDPDRGDERERGSRDRDEHWRDRDWRRDRGMMFSDRNRERPDEDRWSGRGWRAERNESWPQDRWPKRYSANPDDHYRSWRDRHMSELDRDYADYCRERERQFHSDFDDWRRNKYGNPQPLRTGMTQTGMSHDPSGITQAAEENFPDTASEPDATADATLGTNSSRGRNR